MKENTRKVLDYIVAHDGEDFTAKDIAAALSLSSATVNGAVTSFQRHKDLEGNPAPTAVREEKEIELENGTHEKVKFIRLTDTGRAWDPDAEAEAKLAVKESAKAAKKADVEQLL